LEIGEILDRVRVYRSPLVAVTGGEPLAQEQTPLLILRLLDEGFKVLMETNGTLDIARVDQRCIRIVDVKCPSSCEVERNDLGNLTRMTERDELKFVIGDRTDYEYAIEILKQINQKPVRVGHVHFSPTFGKIPPEVLASWILEDHLDARLSLQLHKFIWDPEQRGV